MNTAIVTKNPLIVAAAVQSWTDETTAQARSKRYVAMLQIGDDLQIFPSAPQALASIGVFINMQSIRAAARDSEYIVLDMDGEEAVLAMLEV